MTKGSATLPIGTVTFLFTDIAGSTTMVQRLGPVFDEVLAAHNRIVRAAILDAGGTVVRTEGDSFFAVFAAPGASIAAALASQRGLRDHMWPDGGRVELRLEAPEAHEFTDPARGTRRATAGLVCEIRDDGPGVPDEDRQRIFRPFFTTKSSGTGLGLSICRKIVVAHGGEITVDREDNQTVFRVALPRQSGAGQRMLQEEA